MRKSFRRGTDKSCAVLYADRTEHAFVLAAALVGFDVAEFDTFLEERDWSTPTGKGNLAWFLSGRGQAMQAYLDGDMTLCRALLAAIKAEWRGMLDRDKLLPMARAELKRKIVERKGLDAGVKTSRDTGAGNGKLIHEAAQAAIQCRNARFPYANLHQLAADLHNKELTQFSVGTIYRHLRKSDILKK